MITKEANAFLPLSTRAGAFRRSIYYKVMASIRQAFDIALFNKSPSTQYSSASAVSRARGTLITPIGHIIPIEIAAQAFRMIALWQFVRT